MGAYDYLNARVKGLAAHLFPRAFYDQILSAGGHNALLQELHNSCYGADLSEAFAAGTGYAAIESGLRRNMFRTFARLRRCAPAGPRRIIDMQLGGWDVANIRTILRGKVRAVPPGRITSALLPAGRFDEAQLNELAGQPDIAEVANTLATWNYEFAGRFRRVINDHRDERDSTALETALDRAYFDGALTDLSPRDPHDNPLRDMIRRQIDLVNLRNGLRIVRVKELRGGTPPGGEDPIPGGRLGVRAIGRVRESATSEGAFSVIEETYFAPAIERGILAFGETGRLSVMERFLEAVVLEAGCRLFRGDPLGSGVPLGYLWRKYNELVNLRILVRGLAYDVPVNMIREELVLV